MKKTLKIILIVFVAVLFSACVSKKQQAGGGDSDKKVTIAITCNTAVANWDNLDKSVKNERIVPKSGIILVATEVSIEDGDSVYDILAAVTRHKIHMESVTTPIYNSVYIKGINNLYQFDGGALSGWMYCVNGIYPNYGASRYILKHGDIIEWNYTCDLGRDLGSEVGESQQWA